MFAELSARDVHECHQIASKCRDLGADVDAWRHMLLADLRRVVGAQVIINSEIENFGTANEDDTRFIALHRAGWISEEAETRWRDYAQSIPVERTPEYPYLSKFSGQTMVLSRDQIWGRETWYRSHTFNEIHRECGIDDYVISICPTNIPGRCTTLWLHKGVGSRDFSTREQGIISLIHMTINNEIGTYLAAADEPKLSSLTTRRLEVLARLIEGDSEKQIAFHFGVGKATIHDHILAIYRHFEVSSRGELLAKFIGRARPTHESN
ncbi:MAG: LuxR C-terminal-related transcriptional regulator [Phycisphaerales bacterium]|jgi:DNA-binding CsgD family transcriptional regulator|nr:LuxR C-terminal-related transcriptional regulator [Phycisphaerales bacterium]